MPGTLSQPTLSGPLEENGWWLWRASAPGVEVRFLGRGGDTKGSRDAVLAAVAPLAPSVAWAKQVHSATVLTARLGACGEGDALVTDRAGLALSVATADCVPVLLAGPQGLAAVHAGWRGLVGGVLAATFATLGGRDWTAWIGPAIGPCCYEVDEPVVGPLRAAFPEAWEGWVHPGAPGRPGHWSLDLWAANADQLAAAGIPAGAISNPRLCTGCRRDLFFSYRREGMAGRLATLAVLD